MRAWWRAWRPSIVAGVLAFVIFWCVTEAIALVSAHTGGTPASLLSMSGPFSVWSRWDSGWYLLIARSGYVNNSHLQTAPGFYQDASAFAPLYPLLIRAVTHILPVGEVGAATVVTTVALLCGLVVAHRLAAIDMGERGAGAAVALLLVFPSAFFLHALYAESLLLLWVAGALLAARTRHWWLASALAGAAVLTKVYSIILIVPLAVEYLEAHRWSLRRIRFDATAVVAGPVVAFGALALYMRVRLGDALRFLHAESLWERRPAPPWTAVAHSISMVTNSGLDVSQRVLAAFDTVSPFLLVAGAALAWAQRRRSYAALLLIAGVLFASSATLQSTGRYALTIVPLFIVAAAWLRAHARTAVLLGSASAALGGYFLHNYAVGAFAG
ncbi:MAG: glycosyltransferase family 39 protein [Candidatus Dormibacteraeota bacterium]|nr:glycosyltransferase family 39 protein [Candidatus Dormibacteraeota bacterium]MBV9524888.1 glycosyltransferase family 39 protein [Candidatus Dormibacteraeota bacterium]